MKKFKKSLIVIFAALVLIISSGCSKQENVEPHDDKPTISVEKENKDDESKEVKESKGNSNTSKTEQEKVIIEEKGQSIKDTELSKDLFSGQFILGDLVYTLEFPKSSLGKDVNSSGVVKWDNKNKFNVVINKEQTSDGKFNEIIKSIKVKAEDSPSLPFSIVNGLKIGSSKADLEKTFKVVDSRNDLEKEIKEESGVTKYRYSDGIFITLNFEVKNDKIISIEIILE